MNTTTTPTAAALRAQARALIAVLDDQGGGDYSEANRLLTLARLAAIAAVRSTLSPADSDRLTTPTNTVANWLPESGQPVPAAAAAKIERALARAERICGL